MAKPGYYAVSVGRTPGIYTEWYQAQAQVDNYPSATHQKFSTLQQAEARMQEQGVRAPNTDYGTGTSGRYGSGGQQGQSRF